MGRKFYIRRSIDSGSRYFSHIVFSGIPLSLIFTTFLPEPTA
jgi:hypothetical protein